MVASQEMSMKWFLAMLGMVGCIWVDCKQEGLKAVSSKCAGSWDLPARTMPSMSSTSSWSCKTRIISILPIFIYIPFRMPKPGPMWRVRSGVHRKSLADHRTMNAGRYLKVFISPRLRSMFPVHTWYRLNGF